MRLSEHPKGVEWLRQFDRDDTYAARLALDSLKLVSFSEFEASIKGTVEKLISECTGIIAVFTVDKKVIDPSSNSGSEGRLGHTLTGIAREHQGQLLINPAEDLMFETKVSDVVMIDDFVASGTRVLDFWRAWNSKRLKSWISFGYCKLWLVGYAAHRNGLDAVSRICSLDSNRILFEVVLEHNSDYWPESVRDFFDRNSSRIHDVPFSANFGGIQSPIVFQHGCPDNAPAIFCRNGPSFNSLFPDRSIPTDLYPCFDGYTDTYRNPELLWKAGQPTLALQTLDDISNGENLRHSEILSVLGLLARGISRDRLSSFMTVAVQALSNHIESCENLGLLDGKAKVTPFGYDLLARARRRQYLSRNRKSTKSDNSAVFYVPEQFSGKSCGVQ